MTSDDLRGHLQELYVLHGHLTPQLVVEAARPKASPLHDVIFDRNVKEAAEQYYLDRARTAIRTITVTYVDKDEEEVKVNAYVSVSGDRPPHRVYRRTDEVAQDPLLAAMMLRNAERDWRTLKARYQHLAEFFAIVRADLEEAA